ncbi:hypothetical protein BDR22DRAFT_838219 [Usnea florida]
MLFTPWQVDDFYCWIHSWIPLPQHSQSSFPDCCIGEYEHSQLHIIPFLDSPSAVKLQHGHPPLFKAPSLPPGPSFLHYPAFSVHLPSLYICISQSCRAICWST